MYEKFFGAAADAKLTFKYQVVNKKESNLIDHYTSEHAKTLQKSRYIQIDDNVEDVNSTFAKHDCGGDGDQNIELRFKFCHPREVNAKR